MNLTCCLSCVQYRAKMSNAFWFWLLKCRFASFLFFLPVLIQNVEVLNWLNVKTSWLHITRDNKSNLSCHLSFVSFFCPWVERLPLEVTYVAHFQVCTSIQLIKKPSLLQLFSSLGHHRCVFASVLSWRLSKGTISEYGLCLFLCGLSIFILSQHLNSTDIGKWDLEKDLIHLTLLFYLNLY